MILSLWCVVKLINISEYHVVYTWNVTANIIINRGTTITVSFWKSAEDILGVQIKTSENHRAGDGETCVHHPVARVLLEDSPVSDVFWTVSRIHSLHPAPSCVWTARHSPAVSGRSADENIFFITESLQGLPWFVKWLEKVAIAVLFS